MFQFKSIFIVLCLGFISTSCLAGRGRRKRIEPVIIVHGGAGDIAPTSVECKNKGCIESANRGYRALTRPGGSAIEAVLAAVGYMEEDACFNAGYGSVLTSAGKVEMDAAIMNGSDLSVGCVSALTNILHPLQVAERVREKSRHNYLVGEGAMAFASAQGFEILEDGALVSPNSAKALEYYREMIRQGTGIDESNLGEHVGNPEEKGEPGTVGAVAIDEDGNIAAATSTGGLTGKAPGRVGDSSIIGAGTLADNLFVGVSATGHGETIMKYTVASKILALIQFEGYDAQSATEKVLKDMTARLTETAGAISIDAEGNVGFAHTSRNLAWAYRRKDEVFYGIYANETFVKKVTCDEDH